MQETNDNYTKHNPDKRCLFKNLLVEILIYHYNVLTTLLIFTDIIIWLVTCVSFFFLRLVYYDI